MSFMINVWYLPHHVLNDYCPKQLVRIDFKAISVMDENDMGFIHLKVHAWLVINLYLSFNLVSVHF